MATYYVNYAILDNSGVFTGPGAMIMPGFEVPRSMEEINRLGDGMTDYQRKCGAIRPTDWLSVMGWSEMSRS
jgi:hypothetical protein